MYELTPITFGTSNIITWMKALQFKNGFRNYFGTLQTVWIHFLNLGKLTSKPRGYQPARGSDDNNTQNAQFLCWN